MLTLPLSSPHATLENSGGKGSSLCRLSRLGLNVPPGFILTTEAYRRFVQANGLAGVIDESLKKLGSPEVWEQASARIRAAFSACRIPEAIVREVSAEYRAIRPLTIDNGPSSMVSGPSSGLPVAVRSSATAEDLPELSFAGQQDTFLNVIGEEQLRKAIVDCWSSLWTGRAIGYRERNAIRQEEISLAVIIQKMVPSESSGVLFTANPVTGLRSEAVIDAAFGLGEALVSGQVEPDHFVVDAFTRQIKSLSLGAKSTATRNKPEGGVETLQEEHAGQQTLTPEQVRDLVAGPSRSMMPAQ